MSLLEARDIRVEADGTPLLDGVSCTAAAGRVTGLVGPNGAGKTTLLRVLLRLQAIAAGRVLWAGEDITDRPPHRLSRHFAYLAQAQAVHWPLKVDALVTLGRRASFTPFARLDASDRAAVENAIAKTELGALRQRTLTSLSGGERARALLGRVLASDAPVVLADEPVAALDPYHQLNILDILKDLAAAGRAVVIVLHDLSLARRYCDDAIVLSGGRVAAQGLGRNVLTPAVLEPVYGVRLAIADSGAVLPVARQRPFHQEPL
ncbi:MAG: ABC transporter ATP-binding protein [Alphaproteobacteria bacterium]|nr:MAG: ABC transporter ATP-binding protein [Alphaproteobacteria bacterium]